MRIKRRFRWCSLWSRLWDSRAAQRRAASGGNGAETHGEDFLQLLAEERISAHAGASVWEELCVSNITRVSDPMRPTFISVWPQAGRAG